MSDSDINIEIFEDRRHAGKALGCRLGALFAQMPDVLIVAVGRGGVPVAYEASRVLGTPQVAALACRKIPCNANRHVALGTVSFLETTVLDERLIRAVDLTQQELEDKKRDAVVNAGLDQKIFDQCNSNVNLREAVDGRNVVLIDDGVSTGMTALAAIRTLRKLGVRSLYFAAPLISSDVISRLESECDGVISIFTMSHVLSIEDYYRDFPRVTRSECGELLNRLQAMSRCRSQAAASTSAELV